ncbi:MAG: hypothetical protein WC406_04965 [Methanoregula sp.]
MIPEQKNPDKTCTAGLRMNRARLVKVYAGILICIALFVTPALAASQLVAPSAAINGEVYLPLTISGVTGSPGVSFVLSWDPTRLQIVDVIRNSSISGTTVSAKNINATTGTVNVLLVNTASSITADSPAGIADLRIRPVQNGTATITITTAEWADSGFMPKSFDTLTSGTIIIGTPPVVSTNTTVAVTGSTTGGDSDSSSSSGSMYYYEDVPTTVAPEFVSPTSSVTGQATATVIATKTQPQGISLTPPLTTSVPGQDTLHESTATNVATTMVPITTATQKAPGFTALSFVALCIGGAALTLTARKN